MTKNSNEITFIDTKSQGTTSLKKALYSSSSPAIFALNHLFVPHPRLNSGASPASLILLVHGHKKLKIK